MRTLHDLDVPELEGPGTPALMLQAEHARDRWLQDNLAHPEVQQILDEKRAASWWVRGCACDQPVLERWEREQALKALPRRHLLLPDPRSGRTWIARSVHTSLTGPAVVRRCNDGDYDHHDRLVVRHLSSGEKILRSTGSVAPAEGAADVWLLPTASAYTVATKRGKTFFGVSATSRIAIFEDEEGAVAWAVAPPPVSEPPPETPAQRAVRLLDSLGWTRAEAARRLRVHPVHVSRWYAQARADHGDLDAGPGRSPSGAVLAYLDALVRLAERHPAALADILG